MQSLLEEYSTRKYFIEHGVYYANHLAHGIVALHRLGATEDRLRRFVKWYVPHLEAPAREPDDPRDFEDLKGKRVAYYKIIRHYEELLKNVYSNDIDQLVAAEYPKISDGLAGAALHGTIHMGYGYSVKNTRVTLEGLAYVYHSHVPIVLSNSSDSSDIYGKGDQNVLDVLSKLANNRELREAMLAGVTEDKWSSLNLGIFVIRVAYLLGTQAELLNSLIEQIHFPDDCFGDKGAIQPNALMRNILMWTITVYAQSAIKNDFFLLHGVTCAWAVFQVVPLLCHVDGLKVAKDFLMVLFAVYMARNSPALTEPVPAEMDTSLARWKELVHQCVSEDRDEHCYKLVQVCQEMAQESPQYANTCMHAATIVLENEFTFPDE